MNKRNILPKVETVKKKKKKKKPRNVGAKEHNK